MKIFLSVYIINVLSIFFLYLSISLTLHSLSVYRTLLYLPVHISVANSVTLFSRYPPGQPEMRGSSRPYTQSQHNLLILSSKYIYVYIRTLTFLIAAMAEFQPLVVRGPLITLTMIDM